MSVQVSPFAIIPRPDVTIVLEKVHLQDLLPCAFGTQPEKLVSFAKMTRYCCFHFFLRLVVGAMDDRPFHAAEDRFNNVEELRTGRKGHELNDWPRSIVSRVLVEAVGPFHQ